MPTLLELSFGPVQDFIAAARRTADLWAGSRILSELARSAGQVLDARGELIYPDPQRVHDRQAEQSNVSNVLLAKLPDGVDPAQVSTDCIDAAQNYLMDQAKETLKSYPELRQEVFLSQVRDALESYSAWADYPDGTDYRDVYKKLKTAFSQRKNTRDFLAATSVQGNLPKSSLDGLRETVLPEYESDDRLRRGKWRKLHLGRGEQLDALGILKRMAGITAEGRFAALSRLAAQDWLQTLPQEEVARIAEAHEPLVSLGLVSRCPSNGGQYAAFAYDGAFLFSERLQIALGEAEYADDP